MTDEHKSVDHRWWGAYLLFGLASILPSLAIFKKVGLVPLCIYVITATGGLGILLRHILPGMAGWLSTRKCVAGMVGAFVSLTIALAVVHPRIQEAGGFRLLGIQFGASDWSDGFIVSWQAMFAGRYPYYEESFLGNPISPMPGSLLFALPFYLLGITAYQNIFWLIVFWAALVWRCRCWRVPSITLLATLAICPDLTYHLLQGGDYVTNSLYVLLPAMGMLYALEKQRPGAWSLGAAALLGFGLSSRANFLLLLPVIFFAALRHSNRWIAGKHCAVCLLTFALVTVPFYLYDPDHFSPLHTAGKLDMDGRYPHAAVLMFGAALLFSSVLGFSQSPAPNLEGVCARCFIVQAAVILSSSILASIAIKQPNLAYLHFALLALAFGVAGFGPRLFRQALGYYQCGRGSR